MFSSSCQHTVEACNQITFLMLYYIRSRLVTLLKVIDVPVRVSDIFLYDCEFLAQQI